LKKEKEKEKKRERKRKKEKKEGGGKRKESRAGSRLRKYENMDNLRSKNKPSGAPSAINISCQ